jgi:predicted ABC-type ATPase
MGGSPASGKSSFLKKYSPYLLKSEILKVDADEIRAKLPEYEGWNATQTHLETKDIVNTLISDRNIGIPCDFDLIYDGTMNNVKSYKPLIKILRDRGYKIFIVYMDNVPKDVIEDRILKRYQKAGRFVPLEVVDDFFSKGKSAFNELKDEVDGYLVIDGSSTDYNIIDQGGIKLPQTRRYSKLGQKITEGDLPDEYAKGGQMDSIEEKYNNITFDF